MSDGPRTCVIGAGVSGLVAGKALGDWGLEYDCFETSDEVGGNWYFGNPNGRSSAYESLHIDISKDSISFRDFPMPHRYPDYPHHTHIFEWLRDYADAFALRERIRFETEVESAERQPAGGWQITLASGEQRAYDVLVVANGHHWDPRYADFDGHFEGETIHSHDYVDTKTPLDMHGRRILVVGIGNSSVDIASELSRKGVAEHTFLSTRSSAYVMPKYVFGKPTDQIIKTNVHVPLGIQRRLGRILPRIASGRMEDFGLPTPNHRFLEAHPTINSEVLLRFGSGDATAKPDVEELQGDRVRFADGSVEEIDTIVYATGYQITFPFFDPGFLSAPDNKLPLYKRIFQPGIDDLAFVGLGQPIPTIFPFAELQAKLVARYLGGDWALPSDEEMERTIARDQKEHTGHFADRPRHTMQLDWYRFEHDLLKREIPAGRERARRGGAPRLADRAATDLAEEEPARVG